jgi:hypothetical protein
MVRFHVDDNKLFVQNQNLLEKQYARRIKKRRLAQTMQATVNFSFY